MKRVLTPIRDPVVRECLRVPVGTPTAERGLSPASSPGERRISSNGAAALPAMHAPFSPPMSRGQTRVPLSTMQRASDDFQTPAPQQSHATQRVVAGAVSRGTETVVGSREKELAGGALRVVTSPVKGASRYRASYGDGKRKASGGNGAMQLVPESSMLKDRSLRQAAARPTSKIEDSRRRSGSAHIHHALRTSSASVSGGSLGPPLRELRRGSIAHCNESSAGRRERGTGESRQRESTQETSGGGKGDTTGNGKRWSSESGVIHERAARRVSTWSSSSGASSRRSSDEGSCDGARDKSVTSTVRLSSVTGSSVSNKMARRESKGGREGRAGGSSSKRLRDEEEGEEHDKCDGKGSGPSRDEAGFHRGNKRSRESAIMASSSRRSSIWGEGSAVVSGKGVAFADGAQGGDCDLGQRLSIDHFEMNKSLGMGKFGRVYRAKVKQSSKNKTVALKVLSKSSLNIASRQELINLRREVEIQTKLSHSSIVRMVTWFQDSKWFYLVLDYAAGGDVYKALRRSSNGLSHDTAAKYLRDAVSAVAYLHENHVIHRDIKPENLLLDSRGRVKLSDFGWSVHAVPPRFHERQTLCGTPEYAAPEMLVKSPKYKYPVDIWSLGVLSYELLTGKTPFVSSRSARTATVDNSSSSSVSALSSSPCDTHRVMTIAAEIEALHKGDPHAPLYGRIATWRGSPDSLFGEGTLGEAIPDAAQDVVLAMLRPRPEDRYDTREVLRLPWLTLVDPAEP